MKDINKVIKTLFSDFNPKQKKIVNERFGLSGERRTLQAVGDDLEITRERVRQIENQAVKSLRSEIKREFSDLIDVAKKTLQKKGGVCRDDQFIEEIKTVTKIGGGDNIENKLRFVFLVCGTPEFRGEDNDLYGFWYNGDKDKKNLFEYLKRAKSFFGKNKDEILKNKIYKKEFSDPNFENFISISKSFGRNVFGDLGLREWPEIGLKVIKDKAHLVLKKVSKPLHFSEIAEKIREAGIDGKRVHVQTVHNELIKDSRFVLVGRGIYGLKEHGYEGGTVRDVIKKILKENGPLPANEVVKLVNQKKILEENTILLNLRNKSCFESDKEGKYRIRKA